MVRYDAPEISHAVERSNPYAPEVRRRFVALVRRLMLSSGQDRKASRTERPRCS